ncbi:MAG: leucine-rich repeat domain-containing protein [Bacteroidetes bacterium]|nr:leucine-rich repeat domain-containing protein [Bacteroidota bacterium]
MKKLILLSLFLPIFVSAQIVNIPDAIFKAYLVGNTLINTNGDGEIQVAEASAFAGTIDVSWSSISDLTGIEAFTALTNLDCYGNSLTSLDVSKNILLGYLDCWNNDLTSLDVSKNTALTKLDCGNCSLTSLDVSQNTALTYLYCASNYLTSLDVSKNTALTILYCSSNSLTSLDLRNGNNVNMQFSFSTTNNPNLYCISVDDTAWSNTNWSSKKDVTATFSNNCTVGIADTPSNQPSITSHNNTITIKGKGTATIFNLQGQRVHQSKLKGRTSISLDKGIYLVRVSASGGDYRGAIPSVTKKVYLGEY